MKSGMQSESNSGSGADSKQTISHGVQRGMTLAALGIVFGDIGTSPLYSLNAACAFAGKNGVQFTVMGIVSLFFWSLMLVVTVKYLLFVMKADNGGEGGIFALHALLQDHFPIKRKIPIIFLILAFGGALLVGDGVITPSISVLSAIEGLEVVSPGLAQWVVPLTIFILLLLFLMQRFGTGQIGLAFGPIMLLWFLAIGAMGFYQLISSGTEILAALNPYYALTYLWESRAQTMFVLGAVVLCVTGAEALYADMGHFTRGAIARAWLFVAMPALVLNYLGQGALVLQSNKVPDNLFFSMVPSGWLTIALVILATLATIIASQAIISGVFSLTRQAIQLRYCPNLRTIHTSDDVEAQIYVPSVNSYLALACVLTVAIFNSSENLAAAYGMAVTGTMGITSIAYFFVRWKHWKCRLWTSVLLVGGFLIIDTLFLAANLLKLYSGGAYPLFIAAGVFLIMYAWRKGRLHIQRNYIAKRILVKDFIKKLDTADFEHNEGTAVFVTQSSRRAPPTLTNQLRFHHVLRKQNLILTPILDLRPVVVENRNQEIEQLEHGFFRVVFRFGYREQPNLMSLLREIKEERLGDELDLEDVVFHFSRERVFLTDGNAFPHFLRLMYMMLSRNSQPTYELLLYPPKRALETASPVFL